MTVLIESRDERKILAGLVSKKMSEKELIVLGDGYCFSYNKVLLYVRIHKLNKTPKGYSVSSFLINTGEVTSELGKGFFLKTKEEQLSCVGRLLGVDEKERVC